MTQNRIGLGILLMGITSFLFSTQDALSRYLATEYNVFMILMIRFWLFTAFAVLWASRQKGGLKRAVASNRPLTQLARGAILSVEIIIMMFAFITIGLVNTHAVFAIYPLLVTALSRPFLGERIGWRRWLSVAVGFVGVIIILNPRDLTFNALSLLPLAAAALFATYGVLTRLVARHDHSNTSLLYTAFSGMILTTAIGVFHWEPMTLEGWGWTLLLCAIAIVAHLMLIIAYEMAEASTLQPFAYLQLPFAIAYGVIVFGDGVSNNVMIGALIVIGAGIFAFMRARRRSAG